MVVIPSIVTVYIFGFIGIIAGTYIALNLVINKVDAWLNNKKES